MFNQLYRQAAENLTQKSVSIELDGTCWTGTDANKTYLDSEKVNEEFKRLQALELKTNLNRRATVKAAVEFALSLGFTPAMLAVMYPQLEEPLSE